jgi:exodeoxyribonuclease V beta subunit
MTAEPVVRPFALDAALPRGQWAIQASAGTGKTYALVSLAVRFIAEQDVEVSQLLIVTFTRAATSELRSRLRQRLVEVADHLSDPAASETDDKFAAMLAVHDRPRRLERVRRAIIEFDSATITTIHGFATQILGTLGTTSGTDPDASLVDNDDDLLEEACADVLATAADGGRPFGDLPGYQGLRSATERAMACPDTDIVPGPDQVGASLAQRMLTELVVKARATVTDRRRRAGTMSYDDLLTQLRQALGGPGGTATRKAIRERFSVALIDEFQDTDPVQWDVFSMLFGEEDAATSLILVGDPKQAIFAFRGANVHTFLDAVASPGTTQRVLGTNWRSDGASVNSLDILLEGATFGDDAISFEPVVVAPDNAAKRLIGPDGRALPALSLRLALGASLDRNSTGKRTIVADGARSAIFRDVVGRVRELLEGGVLPAKDPDGSGRPVQPSDVAVLVRTRIEAAAAQRAFVAQGIPAVLARGTSVLESPAAEQWRLLLAALIRPSDTARARAFSLSWFVGWNAGQLDVAGESELAALQEQLQSWVDTLIHHGVAPFVRSALSTSGVVARVLRRPDGDRDVTDLQHIGELFHSAAPSQRPSVAGLLSMLDLEPDTDPEENTDDDVTARRIESEAQAVQIMTVWVAKGLEFPIVCVPTMWSKQGGDVIYQDPDTRRRTYDVAKGHGWPNKEEAQTRSNRAANESLGENLRLLYVALTRARHHTILWWTRAQGSEKSGLGHVLFARTEGRIDQEKYRTEAVESFPSDEESVAFLDPLVQRSAGTIAVEMIGRGAPPSDRWSVPAQPASGASLELAHLRQVPDRTPRRWSFTAITRVTEADDFDPFDTSLADSGAGDEPVAPDSALAGSPSDDSPNEADERWLPPMALLPAGPSFGTLVHSVLEEVDFRVDDLPGALRRGIARQLARTTLDLTPSLAAGSSESSGPELLARGLAAVISSPLGDGFGGRTLGHTARSDRIDEMSFELRLGEGGHRPTVHDIGRLLIDRLPSDDPFVPWAGDLAGGSTDLSLAGHLTGSIDAVIRVRTADGTPRFVVVDYKTNRLSEPRRSPGPDDYGSARMAGAMVEHHYPLQALLYSVALHRYLRGRMVDYDPARHLGGAAYLFVRGMTGPDTPHDAGVPQGVFHWHISPALVGALSDLLHGLTLWEVA